MPRAYSKIVVHCVYSTKSRIPSIRYIEHQAQHHATKKFETEYIEMLERAGIKYEIEYGLD